MKKSLLIIGGLGVIAGIFWFMNDTAEEVIETPPYEVGQLTKTYTSDEYRFSLKTPEEFGVKEARQENGTTVTIEDANGNGVQILITHFDEPTKIITKERIQQEITDLKISDAQTLDIGEEYKGVAFKSDNPEFDGASREVWFLFPKCSADACENQLYQISTYERLDPLLKAIFATWEFF